MSSIELKRIDGLPAAKSIDVKIMVSYLVVAVGIILVLYAFSGSAETNGGELAALTIFP
jgi:hypothetical protein